MTQRTGSPLQNRVSPTGALHAVEARGKWMGNRGKLHDAEKRVKRLWESKAWITCHADYRGRKRPVFAPGKLSELFFLDEATAYSAGHRPCGMCRRNDQADFVAHWVGANSAISAARKIAEIDEHLHEERIAPDGEKRVFVGEVGALPDGTFFEIDGQPHLRWHGRCFGWSFQGYKALDSAPSSSLRVRVLTPESVVSAFRHGLQTQVHVSAEE